MVNVAINGFGRIGRQVLRIGLKNPKLNFVAVNDLTNVETLAYLLKHDSVHGGYKGEVGHDKSNLIADGKKILGYGASTKGNVLLQFCSLTATDIPAIAEVNPDKFGCYTPGSHIPIISEADARAMKPDYFLLLPWHFKDGILRREKEYLASGGKFIIPFPEIEIV